MVSTPCDTGKAVTVSPARLIGRSNSIAVVFMKALSGRDSSMKSGHTRSLKMSL